MKKLPLFIVLMLVFALSAKSQINTPKEKAEALAKNEFSKERHGVKEKYGVVKEKHKVVVSTPVINDNPSFYQGNYVVQGFDYGMEIRKDRQGRWMATLKMDGTETLLKNVVINEAYFTATKTAADGTDEVWEGAFINKSDDGTEDFGLGVKLPAPMRFQSINVTKLFFKKVSP